MAYDIKITDGHLQLQNGDLQLTMGVNRIIQQISVGLRILIGDWILDSSAGVDYIGGMRAYPEILSAQIKRAINTVDGVGTVLKYNFSMDKQQIIHVNATAKIGNSEIAINEQINPTSLREE